MTTWYNNGRTAKSNNPLYRTGKRMIVVHSVVNVDASKLTNGDVFVLAEGLTPAHRVHRLMSPNATPALTSATDNDIGIYRKNMDGTLTVVDKDIIVDGATLANALTTRDLLSLNSNLDRSKNIGDLLSIACDSGYGELVLALTMNTKSTADGVLDLDVVIECPTTD